LIGTTESLTQSRDSSHFVVLSPQTIDDYEGFILGFYHHDINALRKQMKVLYINSIDLIDYMAILGGKIDMSGIKKNGTSRMKPRVFAPGWTWSGPNSSLQFGIGQVVVHDGPAVQIKRTEKVRVVKPGAKSAHRN
jgi:hypothetical protein